MEAKSRHRRRWSLGLDGRSDVAVRALRPQRRTDHFIRNLALPLQLMTSLPVVVLDNGGSTIKANVVLNGEDDIGVAPQPRCVFSAASCSCTINKKEIFK